MKMSPPQFKFKIISVIGVASMTLASHAATIGIDNASASAYDSGWADGDNGVISGNAFNAWSLTTEGDGAAGFFIGDSTNLSSPGADINVSGESFGMYAQAGSVFTQSLATRFFSSDLSLGQTFSVELAVNFRNGSKGINLLTSGSSNIFNFDIGGDDYVVSNATTGDGSIANNDYSSDTSFLLEFTQFDGTGGTWSITRSGGVTGVDTGTYSGVVGGFSLYVQQTDGGSPNDLYSNSMMIVPEPSTYAMIAGLAMLTLALIRCRQK
ncbi:PEP-CTERM sorting domain-containing protein [Cerasicoccus arenae]|uniref:PEP-CTERM protein-sorting domain-containing protein n=1 Tax=Cerasicoccus arenae TaxID=424488 RepID=A0A8J3DFC7_9BACT|nr:PEP-CTERM sorting domain-containing protein [Cerasicoccus arenae]MBK1857202.1 PEP-CTERM sorting domain-containing protein [Cerasicoccus arenae]GHB99962.1 hypothetical protein GCM10007047_15220 [Cerasicoccus arenae]